MRLGDGRPDPQNQPAHFITHRTPARQHLCRVIAALERVAIAFRCTAFFLHPEIRTGL